MNDLIKQKDKKSQKTKYKLRKAYMKMFHS